MSLNCKNCIHKRNLTYSCHISCANPDPGMIGNKHGVKKGWFNYPRNFDPVWAEKECDNYTPKGDNNES